MKEKDLELEQLSFIRSLGLPEKAIKVAISGASDLTDLATGLYLLVKDVDQRNEISNQIGEPDLSAIDYLKIDDEIEKLRRKYDQ